MKPTIFFKSFFQIILITASTIIFTLVGLSTITSYDNKYITKAAFTQDNFAIVPENSFCSLVDGWELYPDVLLSPNDFLSDAPSYYPAWAGIQIFPYFMKIKILMEFPHGVSTLREIKIL